MMNFQFNDGGRTICGFKGSAGDCVVRAVAIATEQNYEDVYYQLSAGCRNQRVTRSYKASARNGVNTKRKWFRNYMRRIGWKWTPTMHIGSGCKIHLADGELPMGRLIVAVSGHYTAVIDGVIYDTFDPQRKTYWYGPDGTVSRVSERCVYGYWEKGQP